jgi:membrane protein DedA with SNARE-associated domain
MELFSESLQQYGYPLLVALGLLEFLGVPVAMTPVLLVSGAFAAKGVIHPVIAVASVTAGALVGESAWFGLARWKGKRLLGMACGLASNPNACVLTFRMRMLAKGPRYLVVAKFMPAGGSVPAFAAGLAGFPYRKFVLFDAMALLLWCTAYVGAGWILRDQVEAALDWASERLGLLIGAAIAVFALAIAWRYIKVQIHRRLHAQHAEAQ